MPPAHVDDQPPDVTRPHSSAAIPLSNAESLSLPLRDELVTALYRNSLTISAGSVVLALLLVAMLGDQVPLALRAGWMLAVVLHGLWRTWTWVRWRRVGPATGDPALWERRFVALSLVAGCLWGGAAPWLMVPGDIARQAVLIVVLAGAVSSALQALNASLAAFRAFTLPTTFGVVVALIGLGAPVHLMLAGSALLFVLMTDRFARSVHHMLVDTLRLRQDVVALNAGLRTERDNAEQASLAKSRFLAAASHDLRQPVHALSLFVGALQSEPLEPTARELAERIEGSVQSMGSLFNALLDVSRLDAGAVQPRFVSFALAPLLTRVVDELRPLAVARGIGLRLRLCDMTGLHQAAGPVVESDPVLLERIVRNLVDNGIKFTQAGGVLVACRRRASGGVWLQVWDTGCGIPASRQAEVFDEFVQLHNPQRERSAGLGLGLAIVRRQVLLLGHALRVDSREGRGSVFAVALPLAAQQITAVPGQTQTPLWPAPADGALPVGHGLVLVLDDDPQVRAGTCALLESWGFTVAAAESVAALLAHPLPQAAVPRLIISDFRIAEADGRAAVALLREDYNQDIPAILVTGDAVAAAQPARPGEFEVLLHKPVQAQQLRAAVDAALAQAAVADGPD